MPWAGAVIGGKRGKLVSHGRAAEMHCKRCGHGWFNYVSSRVILTVDWIPTGLTQSTDHFIMCATCQEIGFDLTKYELPFAVKLVEITARCERGELNADDAARRRDQLVGELFRFRDHHEKYLLNGEVKDALPEFYTPAKSREKDQARRIKASGRKPWVIICDHCYDYVRMDRYVPDALLKCGRCGSTVQMQPIEARV